MHELLIFFAVLGGIDVFGVIGVVLGPVVVATTLALLEVMRQARTPPSQQVEGDTLLDRQEQIRQLS
jgi:predicted PurR-regulated permease PerM